MTTRLGFSLRPFFNKILYGSAIQKLLAEFTNLSRDLVTIRSKQEKTDGAKDILAFFQEAEDPETGKKFSTEELIAETRALLLAGK